MASLCRRDCIHEDKHSALWVSRMMKRAIRKAHKNQLFGIIQEKGYDPNLFTAKERRFGEERLLYFVVSLRDSPLFYAVADSESGFFWIRYGRFSLDLKTAKLGNEAGLSWASGNSSVIASFTSWLETDTQRYIEETGAPDLWQTFRDTRDSVAEILPQDKEFEHFSDVEKSHIRLCLNEFRLQIERDFRPTKDQLKSIDRRLEYLSEAVDRHNRFDWMSVAFTTVMMVAVALSLNTDRGRHLVDLFRQVFSSVPHLLP